MFNLIDSITPGELAADALKHELMPWKTELDRLATELRKTCDAQSKKLLELQTTLDYLRGEINALKAMRCHNCKHYFADDRGNVVIYCCELNHERMRDDFFCADWEREGIE